MVRLGVRLPTALWPRVGLRSVRHLRGRATRLEGRGPGAVEDVNAGLAALGAREATDFVLGGATSHVFRRPLDADVVVDVAPDAATLPTTWAAATRFACPAPPLPFGADADDALPGALADERLFARDPASLTFVLAGQSPPEPTFARLDALFPGSRSMFAHTRRVKRRRRGGDDEHLHLAGAVLADVADARPLAATLAELAPHDFKANAAMARDLFLPVDDAADAAATPPPATPCFVLADAAPRVGETAVFHVFESRYKLMIRECVERRAPLLVVGPAADAVGSLCRVADARHDAAAAYGSAVALECVRRAVAPERAVVRAEFGLVRAMRLDDAPPDAE